MCVFNLKKSFVVMLAFAAFVLTASCSGLFDRGEQDEIEDYGEDKPKAPNVTFVNKDTHNLTVYFNTDRSDDDRHVNIPGNDGNDGSESIYLLPSTYVLYRTYELVHFEDSPHKKTIIWDCPGNSNFTFKRGETVQPVTFFAISESEKAKLKDIYLVLVNSTNDTFYLTKGSIPVKREDDSDNMLTNGHAGLYKVESGFSSRYTISGDEMDLGVSFEFEEAMIYKVIVKPSDSEEGGFAFTLDEKESIWE